MTSLLLVGTRVLFSLGAWYGLLKMFDQMAEALSNYDDRNCQYPTFPTYVDVTCSNTLNTGWPFSVKAKAKSFCCHRTALGISKLRAKENERRLNSSEHNAVFREAPGKDAFNIVILRGE